MAIDFSTALPVGYTPATATSKSSADYQSFLKLLVAQMKNQDPSNPMDATQYVAQLATFSQVEQSVQMNSKLEQMLTSQSLAQADAIIGRQVTSADGKTTGVVEAVKVTSSGLVAMLEGGGEMAIGAGITIKAAEA